MSEMIERVARAIEQRNQSLTTTDLSRKWEMFAHAAIEAMREPTEKMSKAAWDDGIDQPVTAWKTMIDAALRANK